MAYKNRAKANLGMQLERIINMANNKYRNAGVADIRKVPTPVTITSFNGRNVTGRKKRLNGWITQVFIKVDQSYLMRRKQVTRPVFH